MPPRYIVLIIVMGWMAASAWLFSKTPQSFLPDEDQGAIFATLRLPEGVSVNRTEEVVKQVEDIARPIPGVQGVLSVVGLNFIDYVPAANQAFFVIRLKPYEDRTDPAQSVGAWRRLSPTTRNVLTVRSATGVFPLE